MTTTPTAKPAAANMTIRRADDRGATEIGWLHSRHTFSFGEYYDPKHMGFRGLRVINDDIVEPGMGFGTHGHRDMEIISIVLEGALEHKDSLGHGEVLRPGEVQVMSAGKGIRHSEFNPSATEKAHFLQVWLQPRATGLPPAYGQRAFPRAERAGTYVCVAGGSAATPDGAMPINADADVLLCWLPPGAGASRSIAAGRAAWVHAVEGGATVNGVSLGAGDAVAIEGPATIAASNPGRAGAELLVFDLA